MNLTNDQVAMAIGQLRNAVLTSSAPCHHDAVAVVLNLLAAAILKGDELELEYVCAEWAMQKYPDVAKQAVADWDAGVRLPWN